MPGSLPRHLKPSKELNFRADENQRKGEIVLIAEGKVDDRKDAGQIDHYLTVLLGELPVKQAVNLVVKMTGENKNDIYKRALELKDA